LLLQRLADKKGAKNWVRILRTVKEPARVLANYPLMSLPGYKSTVALDSGLQLILWGNLPELLPYGLESLVLLHPNDKFDLDLTLQRGRIRLINPKDQPLKARVRFDNPANPKKGEVWDLTLHDKGTEVVLMLLSYMPIGEPFYPDRDNTQRVGPMVDVVVLAEAGKASLRTDLNAPLNLAPPNEGMMHRWNSRMGPQNIPMEKGLPPWVNSPPPVDPKLKAGFLRAVDSLNTELTSQAIDSVLLKAINSTDVYKSRLAVRCAAALDDIQRLLDVLTTDKEREVRWEAKDRLQAWIAYAPDNEYVLYDTLQPAFDKGEAAMFMQLLRNFPLEQLKDSMQGPGIFQALIGYLGKEQRKIAIRELAYYHLWHLVPEGRNISYSATMPAAQLDQAQLEWRKLIPPGSLPPAFKGK
jgi:hypothetical protein